MLGDPTSAGLSRLKFALAIEEKINAELSKELPKHKIYAYFIAGFRPAPDEDFYLSSDGSDVKSTDKVLVDNVSPTLAGLRTAWQDSPHLMLFYRVTDDIARLDRQTLRKRYMDVAAEAICAFVSVAPQSDGTAQAGGGGGPYDNACGRRPIRRRGEGENHGSPSLSDRLRHCL